MEGTPVFCRACGKQIEEGARFCRFCGKSQADGPVSASARTTKPGRSGTRLERRIRQIFPRHHLQDEVTHFLTIAAMVIAVVGFLIALFPPLGGGLYALSWLLFAIVLMLFVMHRDTTLGHVRGDRVGDEAGRYHAARGGPPPEPAAPVRDDRGTAVKEPKPQK
jgi:hypothetical protein